MKFFRIMTTWLIIVLVVSALLHVLLLASDSPDYRRWVYVQISFHLVGAWLLWHVRKFSIYALAGFIGIAVSAIVINATYLNYGNGLIVWVAPVLFLTSYTSLAFLAKEGFVSRFRDSA